MRSSDKVAKEGVVVGEEVEAEAKEATVVDQEHVEDSNLEEVRLVVLSRLKHIKSLSILAWTMSMSLCIFPRRRHLCFAQGYHPKRNQSHNISELRCRTSSVVEVVHKCW